MSQIKVEFNIDINVDELNLPPIKSYEDASLIVKHIRTENFIKKIWGKLKLNVTDDERNLNMAMRNLTSKRTIGKKVVEVDYNGVTEKDNVFWFRCNGHDLRLQNALS